MRKKTTLLRWRCFPCILLLVISSCDPFQEDLIREPITISSSATEYYILPGSSAVIDLKAIVNSSFTKAILKVSESPTRGKLTTLADFLLKYDPKTSFNEGDDQFKIAFKNGEKVLQTVTITVHTVMDIANLPCSIYAVEDVASITQGSSVTFKLLDNDRICGVKNENIQVSIYLEPKYGKAYVHFPNSPRSTMPNT